MGKKWRMVRLQVKTVERLEQLAAVWLAKWGTGRDIPAPGEQQAYSLDAIVSVLLDRDEAHRFRGRRKVSGPSSTANEIDGAEDTPAKGLDDTVRGE